MRDTTPQFTLPRPGKAVGGMMIAITVLWVVLAISVNWGGVGISVVQFIAGSTDGVFRGEVWRLFTAPLLHDLQQPSHLVTTLFGLYFLAPTLETAWGPRRMLLFMLGSGALAFVFEVVGSALIPSIGSPIWYGGLGFVEAIAVAWALQNRHGQVRLFFMIPVSATMLILFVFLMSVAHVIAKNNHTPEGLITPFGGMLAGYLFCDVSPLRRFYLNYRLRQIQAETAELRRQQSSKAETARSRLRVIEGGAGKNDDDDDKRYLN
jgi:membrane associated rhomboid family serine protease